MHIFLVEFIYLWLNGLIKEGFRFRQNLMIEMAHYATDCWDCELLTSYGWIECWYCR